MIFASEIELSKYRAFSLTLQRVRESLKFHETWGSITSCLFWKSGRAGEDGCTEHCTVGSTDEKGILLCIPDADDGEFQYI